METDPSSQTVPTFGYGSRSCIGKQFAVTEAAAVLAMMYQKYIVDFPEGVTGYPAEKIATARCPKGQTAPMILKRRTVKF